MSDKTKRIADDKRISERFEAERPKRYPMPKCDCGNGAKVASDQRGRTLYFCATCVPADIRAMIVNSPLYAGRNPFE